MKIIRKFFSWTLLYKTVALLESIYTYIKDWYYVSDTFYSDEFKQVIKRYLYVDLKKDWLGRLYGIINPNIGPNGKYDFSNTIFEIDGDNTNNDAFVKNIIFGKLDLIDRQFHINKLYEYINIEFEHVGPSWADNYLFVFDMVSRRYMAQCFKSWYKQIMIYILLGLIVFGVYTTI